MSEFVLFIKQQAKSSLKKVGGETIFIQKLIVHFTNRIATASNTLGASQFTYLHTILCRFVL